MLIGFLLLVALAVFIMWDSRRMHSRPAEPIARDKMLQGFSPTGLIQWQLWLGFGGISLLSAYGEWAAPSKPPFTGRWGWMKEAAYQSLGSTGILYLYLAFACMAFAYSFSLWNSDKSRNAKR